MADNEQYRGEVDGLLAKFGIPYRLLQMDASIGGGEIERRLSQWAQSNPNDPMAAQIQRNLPLVRDSLFQSVRGLRSGEDINPAVGRLRSALSGPQAQSGAQNININDGGQDVQAQDPVAQERANLTKWMTEFTQSLGRPLDMNDPVFASLSKLGAARASMGVGASGVRVGRGGIGELGIQQGAMNAALPYAQQRQQMLQQGLGMLSQRDTSLEQLRQGAYGLDLQQQQMQNNVTQRLYGQQTDAAGGVGGAVGGLLGALGTAGLAAIPGVGPAIATAAGPGLIKGGSSIGAGFGMNSVQRPTYSAPRPYGSFGTKGGGY